ncbi:MAG: hypothetical protein KAI47_20180 [Deltaproteobacteria bacterium]|nr:hypothetical protein [Deltaproteobacteria bacterium]
MFVLVGSLALTIAACSRYGFSPAGPASLRDSEAGLQPDASFDLSPPDDFLPTLKDALSDTTQDAAHDAPTDTTVAWPVILAFHTVQVSPKAFYAKGERSGGGVVRWELGDSAVVHGQEVTHHYSQTGDKTVHVRSSDGPLGFTSFYLVDDALTGTVPDFSQLSALESIYLNYNHLTGSLSSSLTHLGNLTSLHLSHNELTGAIPASIGQLVKLKTLLIQNNKLSGAIPAELGKLADLQTLLLDSNQLSGVIPAELGKLKNLTHLYLQDNALTGIIPSQLGDLSHLDYLYLQENNLTGYAVGAFSKLIGIVSIRLQDNQLTSSALDDMIDDIYTAHATYTASSKTLDIGGTNEAVSAAACLKVNTLRNSYGWTINCNGC